MHVTKSPITNAHARSTQTERTLRSVGMRSWCSHERQNKGKTRNKKAKGEEDASSRHIGMAMISKYASAKISISIKDDRPTDRVRDEGRMGEGVIIAQTGRRGDGTHQQRTAPRARQTAQRVRRRPTPRTGPIIGRGRGKGKTVWRGGGGGGKSGPICVLSLALGESVRGERVMQRKRGHPGRPLLGRLTRARAHIRTRRRAHVRLR